MKCISAKDILPDSLVRELQTYIQGGYIYVPTDEKRPRRYRRPVMGFLCEEWNL